MLQILVLCFLDYNLTELNLNNFNTESVTNMNSLFFDCKKLVKLDLSNFKT